MKPNPLCLVLRVLAERTWHRMGQSVSSGIWLREDAYTAINLQDLFEFHGRELLIVDFSPHIESNVTGADWEWWFLDRDGAFGAAVQAKCLRAGHYDLGYTPKGR